MSNVDINVDRQTDGPTDRRCLYRTLLQAGAIKMDSSIEIVGEFILSLIHHVKMCIWERNRQRRARSACASLQSSQRIYFSLKESLHTVVYINF